MDDLNKMRDLAKKAELIQELNDILVNDIADFANRPEIQTLDYNAQLSIIHSSLLSLMAHFQFHEAIDVKFTSKEEIERALEVVELEDQLKKEEDGTDEKS